MPKSYLDFELNLNSGQVLNCFEIVPTSLGLLKI